MASSHGADVAPTYRRPPAAPGDGWLAALVGVASLGAAAAAWGRRIRGADTGPLAEARPRADDPLPVLTERPDALTITASSVTVTTTRPRPRLWDLAAFPLAVWVLWRVAQAVLIVAFGGNVVDATFRYDGTWFRSVLEDGYVVTDRSFATQQNPAFMPGVALAGVAGRSSDRRRGRGRGRGQPDRVGRLPRRPRRHPVVGVRAHGPDR